MKTITNVSSVENGAGSVFESNPVATVVRDAPVFIPYCYCICRCACGGCRFGGSFGGGRCNCSCGGQCGRFGCDSVRSGRNDGCDLCRCCGGNRLCGCAFLFCPCCGCVYRAFGG